MKTPAISDAATAERELNGENQNREPDSHRSEPIASWQVQEQPRHRLLSEGAAGLSTAELLAICWARGSLAKMLWLWRADCSNILGVLALYYQHLWRN